MESVIHEIQSKIESAPNLILQIYWGLLFTKVFGYSYTTLRISTLVAGYIGLLFVYKLIFRITSCAFTSVFIALLVVLNPLYFSLTYTFMTDIPFLVLTIISLYYYYAFTAKEKFSQFLIAAIVSLASFLIRQPGIILPILFAACYCVYSKFRSHAVYKSIVIVILTVTC